MKVYINYKNWNETWFLSCSSLKNIKSQSLLLIFYIFNFINAYPCPTIWQTCQWQYRTRAEESWIFWRSSVKLIYISDQTASDSWVNVIASEILNLVSTHIRRTMATHTKQFWLCVSHMMTLSCNLVG